jgi:pimeloyl-ACP methyl ester carboxylesterase
MCGMGNGWCNLLLICAAGLTLAWLVAAQRRRPAYAARRFVALPRLQQVLVVFAVCILTVCAQKSGSNVVSNAEITEEGRRGEDAATQSGSGLLTASTKEETATSEAVGRPLPLSKTVSAISDDSVLRVKTSLTSSPTNPCQSVQSVANSQSVQFVANIESESLSNHICSLFTVHYSLSTNEVFAFSPPEGACLATNWLIRGAATDYRRIRIDGEFPFDGVANSNFVVFANGEVYLQQSKKMLKPFSASLGIVPVANWGRIVFNAEILEEGRRGEEEDKGLSQSDETSFSYSEEISASPSLLNLSVKAPQASTTFHSSQFWHKVQDDGSLFLTWQNALLNREATNPVSFQAELAPSGSITYRYDFSNLASDELLTNAVVAIGDMAVDGVTNRAVTSVALQTEEDRLCDESRERFNEIIGDVDPFSYPDGSTNMVWEHVVYTGTTNAPFAYPEASADTAILRVTCSGSGTGELIVGERGVVLQRTVNSEQLTDVVAEASGSNVSHGDTESLSEDAVDSSNNVEAVSRPLQNEENDVHLRSGQETPRLAAPSGCFAGGYSSTLAMEVPSSTNPCQPVQSVAQNQNVNKILIPVQKGVRQKLYLRHDGTLNVSLDSDDFTYGRLPKASAFRRTGWIVCPRTAVTPACFHNWNYPTKRVSLVGAPDAALTCTWTGTDDVEVENEPPHAATLTGAFSPSDARQVSYALAHPQYLFGRTTFQQTARYCPKKADDVDDDLTNSVPYHEESQTVSCWQCYWGRCSGNACSCDVNARCHCRDGVSFSETEEPEDPGPGDYEQAKTNAPCLTGVLKIRDPLAYSQEVYLRVPSGSPNCCPCPEHATNCVEMTHCSSRLKVVDESGADFERTMESTTVRVAAVRPSEEIGDARIHFSTNGAVMLTCKYTVLGVGIEGNGIDLNLLNNCNRSFGLPFTMGTNEASWMSLRLMTNVRLPTGNIHLGFENATAAFELKAWDSEKQCYWTLCRAGEDVDVSLTKWRKLVGASSDGSSVATQVYVTSPTAGTATLVFRYWGVVDGKFVEDEAGQSLTAIAPPLKADVNHDGKIDGEDAALSLARRPFRFWFNEDTDKGDYIGHVADDTRNTDDLVVNGKLDLVNLFPIELDLTKFRQAWGGAATAHFFAHTQCLRYCVFADSVSDDVARFVTTDLQTADCEAMGSAELAELGSGREAAFNPWNDSRFCAKPMTLAFEAAGRTYDDLTVEVCMGGKVVYSYRMPISISSVDDMYRYSDLRGAIGNAFFSPTIPGEPWNLPDAETDGRHFVFVHGYNVDAASSRKWARAMFKRLWWAGARSKFTAVDWRGDDSQIAVPTQGDISPNYYVNVKNAFMTAPALVSLCGQLPGEKVMLGHSLGNMLVSSAAVDHGLSYSKYYMLNAAVPMEAYDRTAADDLMVDGAWADIDESFRASRFANLFTETPSDFRAGLSWRGRFAGIANAVNCYSPTEEVLTNPTTNKIFGVESSNFGGAWSKQELFKGCALWYGVNAVTFSGTEIEGGWGINAAYTVNPLAYVPFVGLRPGYFENWIREDMITDPLFTSFNDERMASTNVLEIVDDELRAKMLGDAIPAESFAAGANMTGGVGKNHNLHDDMEKTWPKVKGGKTSVWEHSDIKNVAYFYLHKLFKKISNGEL